MIKDKTTLWSDVKTRDKLDAIKKHYEHPNRAYTIKVLADKEMKRIKK